VKDWSEAFNVKYKKGWPDPKIYTVFIRYSWQEYHQIYDHIRCIYTVLANPKICIPPPPHPHPHIDIPTAKHIPRVGQNRIYTPYMTIYFVISQRGLTEEMPENAFLEFRRQPLTATSSD
jgi:hypothetical protein